MNEWWLLGGFIVLLSCALVITLYPLRKQTISMILLAPVLFCLVSVTYWRWGSWVDWKQYIHQQEKQRQVQVMLQSIRTPQELIDKLKARVQQQPGRARGWYLLGRLYSSQAEWSQARDSYAKAYRLDADEQTTVNYAYSLWQLNHQQFNGEIRALYESVLRKNVKQPDALAMLAMDAYIGHAYQQAIDYWQQLLKMAPIGSEDAQAIQSAIVKAQQKMG